MNLQLFKYSLLSVSIIFLVSASPPNECMYTLSKDYAVIIHGTSNLHNWDEKVETVAGECIANHNDDGSYDLRALSLKISVFSIKSDFGTVMNDNTYGALGADANPEIVFTLCTPIKLIRADSIGNIIYAKGDLTIAGVTKPIDTEVKVLSQKFGELEFEGLQAIKMSDYNVEPPTALFGKLRTGDEITVNYKTKFVITSVQ